MVVEASWSGDAFQRFFNPYNLSFFFLQENLLKKPRKTKASRNLPNRQKPKCNDMT